MNSDLVAPTGSYAAGVQSDRIPAASGATLQIELWSKVVEAGASEPSASLNFYDQTNSYIGGADVLLFDLSLSASFQRWGPTFVTVPANAHYFTVLFDVTTLTRVYIDGVCVIVR